MDPQPVSESESESDSESTNHATSQRRNSNISRPMPSVQLVQSQLYGAQDTPFTRARDPPPNLPDINPIRRAPFQHQAPNPQPIRYNDFDRMFQEVQNQNSELESVGLGHLVSPSPSRSSEPLLCDSRSALQAYLIRQQLVAGVPLNQVISIYPATAPRHLNTRCSVPSSVNLQSLDPNGEVTIPRIPSPSFDGVLGPLPWYPTLSWDTLNMGSDDSLSSEDLDRPTVLRQNEVNEVVEEVLREIFPDYNPSASDTDFEMMPNDNSEASDAISSDSIDQSHDF